MPHSTHSLLYRWFNEVWNNSDQNSIDALMADQAIFHNLTGGSNLIGPENFKVFYNQFRKDFPHFQVTVGQVDEEGDIQSAICMVEATDGLTGIKIEFSDTAKIRIEDGKITEAWNHFDDFCYQMRENEKARPHDSF
jgi:predicted SnoaL-like aldol condensation-catalyzing enzyme